VLLDLDRVPRCNRTTRCGRHTGAIRKPGPRHQRPQTEALMLKKTLTTLSVAALAATAVQLPTAMAAPASPDTSVQLAACGACAASAKPSAAPAAPSRRRNAAPAARSARPNAAPAAPSRKPNAAPAAPRRSGNPRPLLTHAPDEDAGSRRRPFLLPAHQRPGTPVDPVNFSEMVGAAGFEPATFRPPVECATRLRHAPSLAHLSALAGFR
jgi:hypothetical protein